METIRRPAPFRHVSRHPVMATSPCVARCVALLAAGMAAALVFTGAAAAAERRIFLITAADKGNFAATVREKMQEDENRMLAVFRDQAGASLKSERVPNERPIAGKAISDAIDNVAKQIGRDDAVVFYFSGHGAFDRDKREFWFVTDQDKSLQRSVVRDRLLAMRARLTVLLSDCCAADQRMPVSGGGSFPLPPPMSPLFKSLFFDTDGIVDITSSTPPELSWVSGEHNNSVFTWALVKTLRDRKGDGDATWSDVFASARDLTVTQSKRESERFGGDRTQVPVLVRYEGMYRGRKIGAPAAGPPQRSAQGPRFGLTMRLLDDGSAQVTAVAPGSPIDGAGIEAGDVIVRWAGVGPFESLEQLNDVVDGGGDDVTLTVTNQRDGRQYDVRVRAARRD